MWIIKIILKMNTQIKRREFLSLGFLGWSLMYNFGFWEQYAQKFEDFPTFRQTSRLSSSGRSI